MVNLENDEAVVRFSDAENPQKLTFLCGFFVSPTLSDYPACARA